MAGMHDLVRDTSTRALARCGRMSMPASAISPEAIWMG